jgi:hypothetical protein
MIITLDKNLQVHWHTTFPQKVFLPDFTDGLCKLSLALLDLVISVHVLSLNTTAIFVSTLIRKVIYTPLHLEDAVVGGTGMDYVSE